MKFPISIYVTLRAVCNTEVIEAANMEEAIAKAKLINPADYTFDLPESENSPEDLSNADCVIDVRPDPEFGEGEAVEVRVQAPSEPFSWEAAALVKRLAQMTMDDNREIACIIGEARILCGLTNDVAVL